MTLREMSWLSDKADSRIRAVPYRIHSSSSYSKDFTPARILPNKPEDHTSRWSCQAGDSQPWLLLELNKPAVLHEVVIGKYKEEHPCNAQNIKILAGNDPSHLEVVLDINLKNDSTAETAQLRHSARVWAGNMSTGNLWDLRRERNTIPFPVKYVKLMPGRAYEPRYNVSLWHIKLAGIVDAAYIDKVQQEWSQAQKLQKDRLVLKHLRCSSDLRPAFQSVLQLTQYSHDKSTVFEHPTVTRLFDEFVLNRNYTASEEVLQQMYEQELMKGYEGLVPKSHSWRTLHDGSMEQPSVRGGHSICAYNGTYWLFGGNDGRAELNDFWQGSLRGDSLSWTPLERRLDIWPDSRGRHLMTATRSFVYLIDRAEVDSINIPENGSFGLVADDLVEAVASAEQRKPVRTASLWQYDIAHDQWRNISQLCIPDANESVSSLHWDGENLIVGKIGGQTYSVSRYHVASDTWRHDRTRPGSAVCAEVEEDCTHRGSAFADCFDSVNMRRVVVTPRNFKIIHDLANDRLPVETVPSPSLQNIARASGQSFINLSGTSLILIAASSSDCLIPWKDKQTSILAYSITQGEWQELSMDDDFYPGIAEASYEDSRNPQARKCGHEMAYDRVTGRCLFYGGRTDELGMQGNLAVELVLRSVREVDVLRKCRRSIRRQRFFHILSSRSSLDALAFLQDALSDVTDSSDFEEQRDLKALFTSLVRETGQETGSTEASVHRDRDSAHLAAFQEILQYVSPRYKEPAEEIMTRMKM